MQSYGSQYLDASALIMPLVFFMAPNDPKMLKTIDAISKPPAERGLTSDGLVYRYDVEHSPDGVGGEEGTFNMCSFWLVEALTRAGRTDPKRLDEARLLFERMLGYANHLGLYAEETGLQRRSSGQFSAGIHPPGPDQRRLQPRPQPRPARLRTDVSRMSWSWSMRSCPAALDGIRNRP